MPPGIPQTRKFTAIWQSDGYYERKWMKRLFDPYIAENLIDGKHEIVADNAIVFDAYVYSQDPAYYARFKGKNAFLVHLGDEYYELGTDRYVHFRGVFRTIWSGVFNPRHVMVLPLGFSKDAPSLSAKVLDRRYAWSFIGEAGKGSRPDVVRGLSRIEPHIAYSSTPVRGVKFFDLAEGGKRKRIPQQDFVQILGQSAFAPAPMGNGSLESCRVYDALEAGAIPIVERRLTLDYFKALLGEHPIPTVSSWTQARRLIGRLLSNPEQLAKLQQECIRWWTEYQLTLVDNIGRFLEERSRSQETLVPLRSRLPRYRLWQYVELMRHHSLPALGRRIERQGARILQQKQWRVAHRAGTHLPPGE